MNKLREIISRNLSGKKVLLLFIITNIVYAFMLIVTIPRTMTFSNGMKLLDMMPMGYNAEYVISLLDTLGNKGREVYLYCQIPVDMIYPFLFGISYCLLIAYFFKKLDKLNSNIFYLCLLPLIGGIADYLENFGIISMLNNFPQLSQIEINFTNIFSMIKSISTTVYFIVLIITLMAFGIKTLNKNKTSASNV